MRVCAKLALLMILVAAPAAAEPLSLLDSFDDWERLGGTKNSFQIEDGILICRRSDREPAALLTKRDFENFELQFEFKVSRWCESGLYIHAPRNGAFKAGIEIELSDHVGYSPSPYTAGAVFGRVAPRVVAVKKDGEWNTCHVAMNWPRLVVHMNDQLVQDIDFSQDENLRYTLRRGAIGFENTGFGIEVRNLALRPLPDSERGIPLFNGKDLTGWSPVRGRGVAKWDAHDGILTGSVRNGYLKHEMVCQDFDLRMYLRTSPAANGGVFFRWLPDDSDRGNEIQILDVPGSSMPTGSIYGIARANDLPLTPGKWELLQISVHGNEAVTHINGLKVAETDTLTKIRPGHIVLQMHKTRAKLDFKEIVLVPAD